MTEDQMDKILATAAEIEFFRSRLKDVEDILHGKYSHQSALVTEFAGFCAPCGPISDSSHSRTVSG
jgi:hypothetical protein